MGSGKWFTMAGLATAESPVCQEQRPTRGPSMVTNKPPGGRMSTLNSFHLEEAVLCASETLVTHTLLPFLGSSKEGSEAASSKMKEIIRPGWTGNRLLASRSHVYVTTKFTRCSSLQWFRKCPPCAQP